MVYHIVIYLVVLFLYVSADTEVIQSNSHIVGGNDADIANHPYIVSIRRNGKHFCGGSIFSPRIVITASHCMTNKFVEEISVAAGSAKLSDEGQIRPVKTYVLHPTYSTEGFDYDVALLLLQKPLIYNSFIKPISLAKELPPNGAQAVISGWGYKREYSENSERLQEAFINIISRSFCEVTYGELVTSHMLCTDTKEGRDSCQNDSGGPLVYDNKLLGIVSFGLGCATGFPGVYTSIPATSDWIYETSKKLEA